MKRKTLEEAEIEIQRLGRALAMACPEGWGFVLALSTIDEAGYATYISNIERDGAIQILRHTADAIEGKEPTC